MLNKLKSLYVPRWVQYLLFLQFIVVCVYFFAYLLIGTPENLPPNPAGRVFMESHFLSGFINEWNRWDTIWFTDIANRGFGQDLMGLSYAPLYPLTIKILGWFTDKNYISAALLISTLATYFLGHHLWHFFMGIFSSTEETETAFIYFIIFPYAFILFSGYTESLFLVFLILSWRNLYEKRIWYAGFWGALATLTRFTGLFLVVPFAIYVIKENFEAIKKFNLKPLIQPALALSQIPLVFFGWAMVTKIKFGVTPWEALNHYFYWTDFSIFSPVKGIIHNIQYLLGVIPQSHDYGYYATFINLFIALIIILVSILGFKYLSLDQKVFIVVYSLLAITRIDSNLFLSSTARYTFIIIPFFICLTHLLKNRKKLHKTWIVISALLLITNIGMFYFSVFIV